MINEIIEGTLIIKMDRVTGEEISREITNIRPATGTWEEYMSPAVEYLSNTMLKDPKFWEIVREH